MNLTTVLFGMPCITMVTMVGSISHTIAQCMHYVVCKGIPYDHMIISYDHLVGLFDYLVCIFEIKTYQMVGIHTRNFH